MEGRTLDSGPPLPLWCSLPIIILFGLLIAYMLIRTRSVAARYLIFACWLRYALSALHQFTFQEVGGGLSLIALGSIGIVGLGVLLLDKRIFFAWPFMPVALISLLMVISAIFNHDIKTAIEPIVRNGFFVVITVAMMQSLREAGERIVDRLLLVFAMPIVLQIASLLLHVAKRGEIDGSSSYIGGYNHEQQFSLILFTCFVVVCFARNIRRVLKVLVSVFSLIGIAVANYRTTILAMFPLALVQLYVGIPATVLREQRRFMRMAILVVGVLLFVIGVFSLGSRFGDLQTAFAQGSDLIKPPQQFTLDDRHTLSARPFIWSNYIYAYMSGTTLQKFFGFGPDSWTNLFSVYAHNTAISMLYELGIFGVVAIFLVWATMAAAAFKVRNGERPKILAAHLGFFMLNMATMPHWQVEGNILYGIICGYTLANSRARRSVPRPRAGEWRAGKPAYASARVSAS